MADKQGKQTYMLSRRVYIGNMACIVGPREKQGPLGEFFDQCEEEDYGEDTWEKGESRFLEATLYKLLSKLTVTADDIDCVLAGDLLNQCTSSAFGIERIALPYIGLFGACSTMALGLCVGALLIDGQGMNNVICITSSNYCGAEKQFRFPLELGNQRVPYSTCTVTGSGAAHITSEGTGPYISCVTIGKIENYDIKDANNMGTAMAPAAASVIIAHLKDTGRSPDYYDMIITGDLGITGSSIAKQIIEKHGYSLCYAARKGTFPSPISPDCKLILQDCGALIFDPAKQDTCGGGSGCGCAASVLSAYLYPKLVSKELNKILFVATGALMSPVSVKQGDPILGIAHAVAIEN